MDLVSFVDVFSAARGARFINAADKQRTVSIPPRWLLTLIIMSDGTYSFRQARGSPLLGRTQQSARPSDWHLLALLISELPSYVTWLC